MPRRRFALLLAALADTAPAAGDAPRRPAVERLQATYDLYLGGLWAGKTTLDATSGAEG